MPEAFNCSCGRESTKTHHKPKEAAGKYLKETEVCVWKKKVTWENLEPMPDIGAGVKFILPTWWKNSSIKHLYKIWYLIKESLIYSPHKSRCKCPLKISLKTQVIQIHHKTYTRNSFFCKEIDSILGFANDTISVTITHFLPFELVEGGNNGSVETMLSTERKNKGEKWTETQINVGNHQVLKPTWNGRVERIRKRMSRLQFIWRNNSENFPNLIKMLSTHSRSLTLITINMKKLTDT